MSGWDGYIDNIMASSCVADVAIYGKEGSLWVAFNEGELKNIPAKTIADLQNNKDAIYESGVVLGNKRYTLVNDQSNALNWVCFKSKACKEDEQKYSAIMYVTVKTLIFVVGSTAEVQGSALLESLEGVVKAFQNFQY